MMVVVVVIVVAAAAAVAVVVVTVLSSNNIKEHFCALCITVINKSNIFNINKKRSHSDDQWDSSVNYMTSLLKR